MPKSKTGPALFELYNKGQGEKSESERVTSKRSPIAESASAFRNTLANLAKTINREGQSEKAESSPERASGGSSVAIDRGCLQVSLTSRMSGIVLAVVLVGAIGVFIMGQYVGYRKGIGDGRRQARIKIQGEVGDDIATARKGQPVQELFAGIGTSPVSSEKTAGASRSDSTRRSVGGSTGRANESAGDRSRSGSSRMANRSNAGSSESRRDTGRDRPMTLMAQPPSSTPTASANLSANATGGATWIKGYNYVIVQSFRSDALADAEKAQAFLKQQGIDAAVVAKAPDKPIQLIATQGFDYSDKTQKDLARRYLQRIRTIGKSYPKVGGRYKLEGYLARLSGDSW